MKDKYPEYILKYLRQRYDLDENDTSMDEKFNAMLPSKIFKEVCEWHGFHNWHGIILGWVEDIFKFDLNSIDN